MDFALTPTNDTFHEADETISLDGTLADVTVTGTTITLTSEDTAPTTLTLTVDADTGTENVQGSLAEGAGEKTVRVTATLEGTSTFPTAKAVTLAMGTATDSATEGTDYGNVADQTITIAVGASSGFVEFALTPTQDTFYEGPETLTLDGTLTGLTVADTSIEITDDDAAPTKLTLTVDADTGTDAVQSSLAEGAGEKTVQVTATLEGTSTFPTAKVVTVAVGTATDSATEGTDYGNVADQSITIAAGASSGFVEFALTPTQDTFHEGPETLTLDGTLMGLTVADTSIEITDDDAAPTKLTLTVDADTGAENVQGSLAEGAGEKTVRVTATLEGTSTFPTAKAVTLAVGTATDSATEGTDYGNVADQTITIAVGASSGFVEFALTPTQDTFYEGPETLTLDGTLTGLTVADTSIEITDDDAAPTKLTLTVDADTGTDAVQSSLAEGAGEKTVQVTATLEGTSTFPTAKVVTVAVGTATDSATEGTDYGNVADQSITIAAGASSGFVEFALTPTQDTFHEGPGNPHPGRHAHGAHGSGHEH